MTNEKAITLVNDAFGGYYSEWAGTFTKAEKDELAEANRIAIEALEQATTAIPLDWIRNYISNLKAMGVQLALKDAQAVSVMVDKYMMEQYGNATCGPDYCEIGGTHD